jgi:hypothetical protein
MEKKIEDKNPPAESNEQAIARLTKQLAELNQRFEAHQKAQVDVTQGDIFELIGANLAKMNTNLTIIYMSLDKIVDKITGQTEISARMPLATKVDNQPALSPKEKEELDAFNKLYQGFRTTYTDTPVLRQI